MLACSAVEVMMHGVKWFTFTGSRCTAVYTDGTNETAEIPSALVNAQRDYFLYQNADGKACEAPNTFALVSAIQSKRVAV